MSTSTSSSSQEDNATREREKRKTHGAEVREVARNQEKPGEVRNTAKQNKGMSKRQQEAGADRLPGETDEQRAQRRATQTDQPIQAQYSSTITSGLVEERERQKAMADQARGEQGKDVAAEKEEGQGQQQ